MWYPAIQGFKKFEDELLEINLWHGLLQFYWYNFFVTIIVQRMFSTNLVVPRVTLKKQYVKMQCFSIIFFKKLGRRRNIQEIIKRRFMH